MHEIREVACSTSIGGAETSPVYRIHGIIRKRTADQQSQKGNLQGNMETSGII